MLAAPFRYRGAQDAEGWPVIPGRYGRLEYHDETALAVYSTRPRVFARLWAVAGVRRWQVGDQEVRGLVRGLVPFARLPDVATLIHVYRQRPATSAASDAPSPLRGPLQKAPDPGRRAARYRRIPAPGEREAVWRPGPVVW
jgi:hypothetical protein